MVMMLPINCKNSYTFSVWTYSLAAAKWCVLSHSLVPRNKGFHPSSFTAPTLLRLDTFLYFPRAALVIKRTETRGYRVLLVWSLLALTLCMGGSLFCFVFFYFLNLGNSIEIIQIYLLLLCGKYQGMLKMNYFHVYIKIIASFVHCWTSV